MQSPIDFYNDKEFFNRFKQVKYVIVEIIGKTKHFY